MSVTRVSARLRRLVARRAHFGCQIDHIISEKHGGPTTEENLAYACLFCNRSKGSDIGSIVPETGAFVRFFNPRCDVWSEHFELREGMRIVPLTAIGVTTERILAFNDSRRILERQTLHAEGRYPPPAAQVRITSV